jgi:hypothetical protein
MFVTECPLSTRDWDDWMGAQGSPFQQATAYGAAMAALGAGVGAAVTRFDIRDGQGALAGRAQVLSRRVGPLRLSLVSRGPVWAEATGTAAQIAGLRALARAAGRTAGRTAGRVGGWGGAMVATPGAALAGRGLVPLVTGRTEAVMDLSRGPLALRAGLSAKWRNRLVHGEGAGLHVTIGAAGGGEFGADWGTDIDWLAAGAAAQARARRHGGLPPAFTQAWLAAGGGAMLAVARGAAAGAKAAGPLAAMLFLRHGMAATYHLGLTTPEGRAAEAHRLLLWRAALALAEAGVLALNLGDIATDLNPGLARFKLGTGATAQRLGATVLVWPAG